MQKTSLVVAGVSFTYWLVAAFDEGFELFNSNRWDEGFEEWYLQLSFAIFIGSIISFFVFKTKSNQKLVGSNSENNGGILSLSNKWKELSSKNYFRPLFISVLMLGILTITHKDEWDIKSIIKDEIVERMFKPNTKTSLWVQLHVEHAIDNAVDMVRVDNYFIFSIIRFKKSYSIFENLEQYDYIGFSVLGFVNFKYIKILLKARDNLEQS
jgi:hypothetical protein